MFTDVADSTLLNSRLGDAVMSPLWSAHDQQSRVLMQHWHAREVGRTDGFLLLFEDTLDALGFAQDYALALRGLKIPLRARVGVHTGPVELRQNGASEVARGAPLFEVDGLALPLAARLVAAAKGGQTLLSAACKQALTSALQGDALVIRPGLAAAGRDSPVRLRLLSHGHWRFKGIDDPIEVFQAGTKDEDFTPPTDSPKAYRVVRQGSRWRPVRKVPSNLPAERDPFFGRAASLRAIADCFEGHGRLVTVLGVGGVGKTRLALNHARNWLGDHPGGAWFCDLSAAQGLQGVLYAVSQALNVPMDKTDPVQLIGAAIAGRGNCLVILDNFEQVARYADETLGLWMQYAPQAHFIVTSRELLGIPGEHAQVLEPLIQTEAESLLRERMAAAGAEPAQAKEDLAAIGPLVEMLDRLPLAIELAAARARVMRPSELLARMGQRFKLLAARSGRHDRQATLRATLDWSWELLSALERAALAQASVFEGGFSLTAAEAVLELPGADAWVADVVQALVEKSLLRRGRSHRFEMLRSVHEYAAARLSDVGDDVRSAAMQRHWCHFSSLDEQAAIAERCVETDNLVTACRRAIDADDLHSAANILVATWAALNLTGPFQVAIDLARALFDAAHPHAMEVALTARWVAGSAHFLAGDIAAAQIDLEEACSPEGSLSLQARTYVALGQLERSLGHLGRADELLEAGLSAARQTGDSGLVCRAYNALGVLRMRQGGLADAHRFLTIGLDAARAAKDLKQQAALLGNIGVVERRWGRDELAIEHYQESLRLAQLIGDRRFEGNTRSNLGLFQLQSGRCEDALVELQVALEIARSAGLTMLAANVSCNLGLAKEELGQAESALDHHREALRLADGLKDAPLAGQFRIYTGRLLTRMGRAQEARATLDEAASLVEDCSDAEIYGLLACANAEWAALQGDAGQLLHWLDIARYQSESMKSAATSELAHELRRIASSLKNEPD